VAALAGRRPAALDHVPARFLRSASDDRLVALVRGGSEPAFEAIFDRHHRALLSFCRHLVGSRQEAEDAVQQTFLAAYRGLLRTDKEIVLRPWLYTIARNQCVNAIRARRERPVAEFDEFHAATDGLADQVQRREDLREMLVDLRRLPDNQRAALVLAELGDLSHEEIGEVIGVRKDKVKALVFQAREALAGARGARAIPCRDIREQIATARGGALRRAPLRRHLAGCDSCRGFRDDVVRQRRAMAALLPVVPSAGLKAGSLPWLAGAGGAAGGGAVAGGAAAVGGGATASGGGAAGVAGVSALASSTAAKALIVGAIAVGTAGSVVGVKELRTKDDPATTKPNTEAAVRAPASSASPTAQSTTPPQSPSSQGVTPLRRAGKGGNSERARERAKARKRRAKREKGERGRSETAPGKTKTDEKGKGNEGSNAGGNGNANGGGSSTGGGGGSSGSNAGGNGNGNGPPALRPAPVTPELAPEPAPVTGGGNANSNGNGAINGGGAKSKGNGADK
jgi:RNA polymerase sigma factor (sigma-70 family)